MTVLTPRRAPQHMPSASGGDFCVMACHFNWANFNRPRQNLARFARQMHGAGVPLFGIELHLNTQDPFTRGWENWTQVECAHKSIMFQKEALLNLLEPTVPEWYKKLAWVDGDVFFDNRDWHKEASALLDEFKVCQLFTTCHFTDKDGSVMYRWPGSASVATPDLKRTHTGFAWAAQRELWRNGGLFPWSITGAGDVFMAASFLGCDLMPDYMDSLGAEHGGVRFKAWDSAIRAWCKGECAYVSGSLFHEWHGSHANRKYTERKAVLASLDLERDVFLNEQGILQWTELAPKELKEYVANYFIQRSEDT